MASEDPREADPRASHPRSRSHKPQSRGRASSQRSYWVHRPGGKACRPRPQNLTPLVHQSALKSPPPLAGRLVFLSLWLLHPPPQGCVGQPRKGQPHTQCMGRQALTGAEWGRPGPWAGGSDWAR